VTAGELVAHREVFLLGDVDPHLLDHAAFVHDAVQLSELAGASALLVQLGELGAEPVDDLFDLLLHRAVFDLDVVVRLGQTREQRLGDLAVGRNDDVPGLHVQHVQRDLLAQQDVAQRRGQLLFQSGLLFLALLFDVADLFLFFRRHREGQERPASFLLRSHLDIHHDAVDAARDGERGVPHIGGLLAEDRAKQALFGRQLRLALGCDFPDQDIAGAHFGTHAHHAVRPQVLEGIFAHVGNIARNLFRAELGVARLDLVLFDVNRGELVLAHQLLADQQGVLVVPALPGQERGQHIVTQRQFPKNC